MGLGSGATALPFPLPKKVCGGAILKLLNSCTLEISCGRRLGEKSNPEQEGLRRYNEKRKEERLRNFYYATLSLEQKRSIRNPEFLKLPTELRMQIYGYLLISNCKYRSSYLFQRGGVF